MKQAKNRKEAISRLADSLVEDVLQSSAAQLHAEAKEDYGDPGALAAEFDRLIDPLLRAPQNSYARGVSLEGRAVRLEQTNSELKSFIEAIASKLDLVKSLFDVRPTNLRFATASIAFLALVIGGFLIVEKLSSDRPISVSGLSPSKPITSAPGESDSVSSNSYVAIVTQGSEQEVKATFRALQDKAPDLLANRPPIINRDADQNLVYTAGVGPFSTAQEASEFCDKLKRVNLSCRAQKAQNP